MRSLLSSTLWDCVVDVWRRRVLRLSQELDGAPGIWVIAGR